MQPDRLSLDEVMHHVRRLAAETPFRKSGSGVDLQAARIIVETLRGYGLEAGLEEFETFDSDPGEAAFEVLGTGARSIEARACAHIEPTPPGGFTGELVDVGPGGEKDYLGKDVRGKVVLAAVSYAPATPEKARIAAAKGAAGIVLMNWGRGNEPGIPWRALKAVWGNPTPESWLEIPRLFGLSISRPDGEDLRARLADGPVTVRCRVTARREWRTLSQPIAWLRAPEDAPERDRFVIVSGHLDSWSPGVTDNITGNAVMLSVARQLAARRASLRRSVVFCFWNGHEVAEAAGSCFFVDAHWERIQRDAVAYLNIDSVGMAGTALFNISSSPELAAFAGRCAVAALPTDLPVVQHRLTRVGDQSFFGIGVPAATGRHGYAPEIVKETNGATLGWYNHTEYDTLDVLDPQVLARDLAYWSEVVGRLATAPILPMRYVPRIDDLRARFAEMLQDRADPAGLSVIVRMLEDLAPAVDWFDRHLDGLEGGRSGGGVRANGLAMRLARHLTFISGTASGRYEQDSYGSSSLGLPIPLLAALDGHDASDAGGTARRLLVTRLMRLRHVITDALAAAGDAIDDFRMLVEAQGTPPRDRVDA